MLTLLIIILITLATTCGLIGYVNVSLISLSMALIVLLLAGNGLIPYLLLRHLQKPFLTIKPIINNPSIIVLLGAGTVKTPTQTILPSIKSYPSIQKTAQLYFNCVESGYPCKIIVSGGDAQHTGVTEAEIYRDILMGLQVNADDIILEPNSMNTFQNAQFTKKLLQLATFKQVLLVTSGIHMQRSVICFKHFSIAVTPVIASYITASISLLPRGENIALTDAAMHEYIGILQHSVYDFLGWNKTS